MNSGSDLVIPVGSKFGKGFSWPKNGETNDWRFPKGSPENTLGAAEYTNMPFQMMLDREWQPNDNWCSHGMTYLVVDKDGKPLPTQPRINLYEGGWDYLVTQMQLNAMRQYLWIDCDLPGHKSWMTANADEQSTILDWVQENPEIIHGAFIKFTRGGIHIIQPLAKQIPVWESDAYERRYVQDLQRHHILVDTKAIGWHRMVRFPGAPYDHKKRISADGFDAWAREKQELLQKFAEGQQVGKIVNRDWKAFILPEPTPEMVKEYKEREKAARSGVAAPVSPPDVPETITVQSKDEEGNDVEVQVPNPAYHASTRGKRSRLRLGKQFVPDASIDTKVFGELAAMIGKAIKEGTQSNLHFAYLHLAVMLAKLGMLPELIPPFIGLICNYAGSSNPAGNVLGATKSVQRWLNGQSASGERKLAAEFPHIHTVTMLLFAGRTFKATMEKKNQRPLSTFEDAQNQLNDAIIRPTEGMNLIEITPGAGKTHAAVRVSEQAQQMGKAGLISAAFNTNALAIEVMHNVQSDGLAVSRLYGIASLKGPGACKFAASAKAIAAGHQPPKLLLCEGNKQYKCPHYEGCKARQMEEGDPDAPLTIGSHGKLPELIKRNPSGTLFIDEQPETVLQIDITQDSLKEMYDNLKFFRARYTIPMRPLLDCVKAYIETIGEEDNPSTFKEMLARAVDAVEETDIRAGIFLTHIPESDDILENILRLADAAVDDDKKNDSPPINSQHIDRIRRQPRFAAEIGRASKMLYTLRAAALDLNRTTFSVEPNREGERVGHLLTLNPILMAAVNRSGVTTLLDATGSDQIKALEKYAPVKHTKIDLEDAVTVTRELYAAPSATRKSIFDRHTGSLVWQGPLRDHLRKVAATIAQQRSFGRGRKVCLITFKLLRLALQYALEASSDDIPDAEAEWLAMGHDREELLEAARQIRILLPPANDGTNGKDDPLAYVVMHFGAERGKNAAKECDTLVTIGDPRPNIAASRRLAFYLGVDPNEFLVDQTASSLAQAQGRGRHVSPFRTAGPLHALHIGLIRPNEPQWHSNQLAFTVAPPSNLWKMAMSNLDFAKFYYASGKTKLEVAQGLKVNRRTVQRWLDGESAIESVTTNEILKLFGHPIMDPEKPETMTIHPPDIELPVPMFPQPALPASLGPEVLDVSMIDETEDLPYEAAFATVDDPDDWPPDDWLSA